jgi:UTP-glucose-1-phosphate uridylyltransferase
MTATGIPRVVVCAGGLGTRVASWTRYLPKEFYPVGGRPGIVYLLEEIAALGPAEVTVVCHPYYERFTAWARKAFSQDGHDSYDRAAQQPDLPPPAAALTLRFITQRGPYADITSVLNGAGHLACREDLYVAFADNLYPGSNPLLALRAVTPGCTAVLARPYQRDGATSRGVVIARRDNGRWLMLGLAEKPRPETALALERRYGPANLRLLEGRARLTADLVRFASAYQPPAGTEPKLALAVAAYARTHPVAVITTTSQVIDLGTRPASPQGHEPATTGNFLMKGSPGQPPVHVDG